VNAEILAELSRVLEAGQPCVLATLVDAHGSTPQKAAASLLLRADGSFAGTLGGGCIEAEAVEAARAIQHTSAGRLLDFELTEDIAVDYGLACGGTERILLAPLAPDEPTLAIVRWLQEAVANWQSIALVTPLDGEEIGRIAAVPADRTTYGDASWLSPGATASIRAMLAAAHPRPVVMADGGREIYVEPVGPPAEVIVVGAGHVGRAVATAAKFLSYRVVVIDDRDDFANRERFPDADAVIADEVERALTAYAASPASAIVIVTRGHKYDYQALSAGLRSRAFYVGLMGSRRKVALIFRQLLEDGIPAERLRDVRAPIGLSIGAMTPEEIAVSIVAEITKERLGGDGAPMKVDERIIAAARAKARI
jgi:xanthine dehydrogenase accessory factor